MMSLYGEIEELLKQEEMVSIFRLEDCGGQSDLDLAILRALLKANTGRYLVFLIKLFFYSVLYILPLHQFYFRAF